MINILLVGIGGAFGAIARYLAGKISYEGVFPLITFFVNLTGCILIGFVAAFAFKKGINSNFLLFLKTVFLGGFTTFSTFSLEAVLLFQNKHYLEGGLYVVLSALFCILGVILGQYLAFIICKN